MTTERLYEFIVLSQTLNYKKAAKQLFLTQSILSRHIMEMEKELGFKLFIRDTRNVALTEAGKSLSQDMLRIIGDCDDVMTRLRSENRKSSASLSVGCTDSCLCRQYIDFIRSFAQEHSDIDLQLFVTQGPIPPGKWMRYDFFLSPCIYSNIPSQFEMLNAFRQPAKLIVPSGHRLCGSGSVCLSQLAGETLLVPCADEPFGPFAKNKQLAEKSSSNKVKVVSSFSIPTAIFLVEMGRGLAIIPPSLVRRENGSFDVCDIADSECNFDLYMYTNTSRQDYAPQLFRSEVMRLCSEQSEI